MELQDLANTYESTEDLGASQTALREIVGWMLGKTSTQISEAIDALSNSATTKNKLSSLMWTNGIVLFANGE
jgi:hypothetical protein